MGNTTERFGGDCTHKWVKSNNYPCDYCSMHNEYKIDKVCTVDKRDVDWNKQMYERRISSSKHIARIFSYSVDRDCRCSSNAVFHLEQEYYVRLENFVTSHSETLYLLLALLYGYGELFKVAKKGFQVELDMIGVSADGEVRVWINDNFSSNQFAYLDAHPRAEMLVDRILELVFSHPGKYSVSVAFAKFVEEQVARKTFVETIVDIKKFARSQSIRIPLCIESAKFMRSRIKK